MSAGVTPGHCKAAAAVQLVCGTDRGTYMRGQRVNGVLLGGPADPMPKALPIDHHSTVIWCGGAQHTLPKLTVADM